jgi:tetratricopeptide (TPR) repeat protein
MKKLFAILIAIVMLLIVLTGCKPPEIEGARVDMNAGRNDQAMENAVIATEKYPANSEAWYLKGSLHGKLEEYSEMLECFNKSLSIDNMFAKDIEQEKAFYFQTVYNAGVNKYNEYTKQSDRSSDEAKKYLQEAVGNFQNANSLKEDYMAVSLSALCYSLLDDDDNALEQYKQMTVLRPDTADAWIALGQFYYNNKDYESSAQSIEKALEIDPENADAISILSQTYDILGNREKAIELYTKAIEIAPEEKAYPFNLGLMYFKMANEEGTSDADKKEYLQKCSENYGKVINLDPEMKDPYEVQSSSLIQLKKYDEALLVLKQAIDYHPEVYSFWFNLGVVYSYLGNKDEAEKAHKKADMYKK